jgi:CDP-glucose 4,6-dehydratase
MEVSAGKLPSPEFWNGKRVLVTGHSGFKGTWLTHWLKDLGSIVMGISLPCTDSESRQDIYSVDEELMFDVSECGFESAVVKFNPNIIFHLAAQSIVSTGYSDPITTFKTNVIGTGRVLGAVQECQSLEACLVITTDKVYDPKFPGPYIESDRLGGHDPYAASKASAELISLSWPKSIPGLVTVRAGNVIGGGDWSVDRLIPDLMRSWSNGKEATLRDPNGVRPWQHVLEPLRGYLICAEKASVGELHEQRSFNFGPSMSDMISVEEITQFAAKVWNGLDGGERQARFTSTKQKAFHETAELTLDSTLALDVLGWGGILDWHAAIELTVHWYFKYFEGSDPRELINRDLESFNKKLKGDLIND